MVSFPKRYKYHPIGAPYTKRLVAPSPAVSRPPLSHFSLKAFLPSLQVTLTSYEQALRLPTSLPHFRFGQTWNETKTLQIVLENFCVHSPAYAFSISPRETLLACPPSPPRNLSSFTVKSTLSSPCSYSEPLSHQGVALVHLDSLPPYELVLWRGGFVSLPFGKAALSYLPTVFSVALIPLFPSH